MTNLNIILMCGVLLIIMQVNARERCSLFTKWIAKDKDMVIHSCRKCGISVGVDGSEDEEIYIDKRLHSGQC